MKRVKTRTSPRIGKFQGATQKEKEQRDEQDDDGEDDAGALQGDTHGETGEESAAGSAAGTRSIPGEAVPPQSDTMIMAAAIDELRAMVQNLQSAPHDAEHEDEHEKRRHGRRQSSEATRRRRSYGRSQRSRRHRSDSEGSEDEEGRRRRAMSRRPTRSGRSSGSDDHGDESDDDDASDDSPSSSESSSEEESSSSDDSSDAEDEDLNSSSESERSHRGGRRDRRDRHDRRRSRELDEQPRRKSVKELELPTFTPSPKVSVSTWIDRVDLALKGAEESGRGQWTDRALYFIMGNKLMENAARWWVNMDRRLKDRKRRWTYLKKALLRRYGERLDKSAAEWRVNSRRMWPGETYADYAAVLREVVGKNRVSERVLLAQFYRCLDKTTRKLVQQKPKPKTLEKAVAKATKIDDPMENVALGMSNIGQAWATAPSPYLVPMAGTMGQTMVIPGVGGAGLPAGMAAMAGHAGTAGSEGGGVALFTNPQGVWNDYSGTWDVPPGHTWNGKYWVATKSGRKRTQDAQTSSKNPERKSRSHRDEESSGAESDARPVRKKTKAAVRQSAGQKDSSMPPSVASRPPFHCYKCGEVGHVAAVCPNGVKCFACGEFGHLARDCTNVEAKSRNEARRKPRDEDKKSEEN